MDDEKLSINTDSKEFNSDKEGLIESLKKTMK